MVFKRILVMGTALTFAHLMLVTFLIGAHLGVSRAVRDLPDLNPPALRVITAMGDVLMLPTSLFVWGWRGGRFPWSTDGLLLTSPVWGFGAAYLVKRRRTE